MYTHGSEEIHTVQNQVMGNQPFQLHLERYESPQDFYETGLQSTGPIYWLDRTSMNAVLMWDDVSNPMV